MSNLDLLAEAREEIDLDVSQEDCAGCRKPLSGSKEDEVVAMMGEDDQGLPGYDLFHEGCLELHLMEAMLS